MSYGIPASKLQEVIATATGVEVQGAEATERLKQLGESRIGKTKVAYSARTTAPVENAKDEILGCKHGAAWGFCKKGCVKP